MINRMKNILYFLIIQYSNQKSPPQTLNCSCKKMDKISKTDLALNNSKKGACLVRICTLFRTVKLHLMMVSIIIVELTYNIDKEIIESTSCVIDRKLNVPKNI